MPLSVASQGSLTWKQTEISRDLTIGFGNTSSMLGAASGVNFFTSEKFRPILPGVVRLSVEVNLILRNLGGIALEPELGLQVVISTTIALGTRKRIAIEEEIASMLTRIQQLDTSEEIRSETLEYAGRIRTQMDDFGEELLELFSELRREWGRITQGVSRRGRPKKSQRRKP